MVSFLKFIKTELMPDYKSWITPLLRKCDNDTIDNCDYSIIRELGEHLCAYIIYRTSDNKFHIRFYIHKSYTRQQIISFISDFI